MRCLLLLRHAKSSWDDPKLPDRERPLAGRGRHDAPRVGSHIAERGWIPDLALVSSAARTRQTWELLAPACGAAPAVLHLDALYMAEPAVLLETIREAPPEIGTLLVVGHNPGLERLAVGLAGPGSSEAALAGIETKYPTAALTRFLLQDEWAELEFGSAQLTDFVRPRDLDSLVRD